MPRLLVENTTVPQPTLKEGRWKAVLITPGAGSSGKYTESVLREHGPMALRKGAKSFVTHNRLENGEPDPFKMWGFLAEDSYYEDGVGLVGELEVLPSWRDRVSEVAPHTALSVYVMGESDADGNVTSLVYEPDNGVDMVVYPGRPGSGLVEKLYESMASVEEAENGTAPAVRQTESKETPMEIQELAEKVDKLAESVTGLVASFTTLSESLKPEEAPEVDLAAVVESVAEAGLPKASRKAVLESFQTGTKIEDAIKDEKARVDEIRKELSESIKQAGGSLGRVVEGGTATEGFSLKTLSEVK